jgi:hypothetical protein
MLTASAHWRGRRGLLHHEIERLRAALEEIAKYDGVYVGGSPMKLVDMFGLSSHTALI